MELFPSSLFLVQGNQRVKAYFSDLNGQSMVAEEKQAFDK